MEVPADQLPPDGKLVYVLLITIGDTCAEIWLARKGAPGPEAELAKLVWERQLLKFVIDLRRKMGCANPNDPGDAKLYRAGMSIDGEGPTLEYARLLAKMLLSIPKSCASTTGGATGQRLDKSAVFPGVKGGLANMSKKYLQWHAC